jgi:GT2 family glycosyltransferase
MEISFIIVNYKSQELLSRCLAAIAQHAPISGYEIVVVNNDETPLKNTFNNASLKIINNNENKGFAKACNIGAGAAAGKILFFLNPDTEIRTSNIDDIVKKLNDASVGIAAPRLLASSGAVQPWSVGRSITVLDTLLNNLGLARSRALWLRETDSEADWVSGAAFAISKKLFSECGGFDENFFMYFEDVDLCRRISAFGKKIFILPQVSVLHIGGQCHSDIKRQKYHYYQSQDYYFKKHFGAISVYLIKFLRSVALFFGKQ